MIALVIGGSGFLGSHVADHLTNTGHSVRVFDRGLSQWIKQDQEMVVGDLLNQSKLKKAVLTRPSM